MERDVAADLAFRSAIDAMRDMSRRTFNSAVHDEDGIVLVAGPIPFPVLVNGVARVDFGMSGPEVIARAREFFGARQRGFTVFGIEGRDDDVIAAAEAAGMIAIGEPAPIQITETRPARVNAPVGVTIRPVENADDVAALADICSDAYSVYGMPADVAPGVHSPASVLLANHVAAVLAEDEDGPVGTATVIATHGVAYVQWVATRQRAFGRGIGGAVTQAATVAGFDLGARAGTLFASEMGAPVYRRLGWTDVGRLVQRIALSPL